MQTRFGSIWAWARTTRTSVDTRHSVSASLANHVHDVTRCHRCVTPVAAPPAPAPRPVRPAILKYGFQCLYSSHDPLAFPSSPSSTSSTHETTMSDDSGSSFGATFLGALEGAISVLLTLAAGYWVARKGMIDRDATHKVSNLCSMLFLPCLIVVQMGPELTASQLRRLWILPIWGFVSTLLAHLMGYIGYKIFKTKNWVIVASGRPNSSALPLLLLKALSTTGILDQFSSGDESSSKLLSRAQSLILLNVVVQQTFTFQIAPWLLKRDKKGQGSDGDEDDVEHGPASLTPASPGKHISNINPVVQDRERVGLLSDQDGRDYGSTEGHSGVDYAGAINPIADRPDIHWPKRIGFLEKPVKKTLGMMSPPLIGAIVALVVGVSSCGHLRHSIRTHSHLSAHAIPEQPVL